MGTCDTGDTRDTCDRRTGGRTDGRTDNQTYKQTQAHAYRQSQTDKDKHNQTDTYIYRRSGLCELGRVRPGPYRNRQYLPSHGSQHTNAKCDSLVARHNELRHVFLQPARLASVVTRMSCPFRRVTTIAYFTLPAQYLANLFWHASVPPAALATNAPTPSQRT